MSSSFKSTVPKPNIPTSLSENARAVIETRWKLERLHKILKQGEFEAAGLSVDLTVGPPGPDFDPDLTVSLSWNVGEILNLVKTSLEQSIKYRLKLAESEWKELDKFLRKEKSEVVKSHLE